MAIKKWWPVLLLVTPLGCCLIQVGAIQWHLYQSGLVRKELVQALQERYPDLTVQGGESYERPVVYLHVRPVNGSAKQAEIRDWLAALKAERGIKLEIWLTFNDGQTGPDNFKF